MVLDFKGLYMVKNNLLTQEHIISFLQKTMDGLFESGIVENKIAISPETLLIGDGATLDSVGFITLLSEIEEKVNSYTNKDIYIVFTDIQERNSNSNSLNVKMLSDYLIDIANK